MPKLKTKKTAATAFAHVTVQPRQSAAGTSEKYTMRVPTERATPTVRVEIEFPAEVTVLRFEPKPGWTIEEKKDAAGKIVAAILSGGSIGPRESSQFVFEARNPSQAAKLSWKVVQIYEDGTRSEWTGPEGSRSPASTTCYEQHRVAARASTACAPCSFLKARFASGSTVSPRACPRQQQRGGSRCRSSIRRHPRTSMASAFSNLVWTVRPAIASGHFLRRSGSRPLVAIGRKP